MITTYLLFTSTAKIISLPFKLIGSTLPGAPHRSTGESGIMKPFFLGSILGVLLFPFFCIKPFNKNGVKW